MMSVRTKFSLHCLRMNRQGNMGLLGALTLPVLIAAGGMTMDMATMVMTKNELQDAVDAAALAGASAIINKGLTTEEAKIVVINYLKGQLASRQAMDGNESAGTTPDDIAAASTVNISSKALVGNAKEYTIQVTAKKTVYFTPLTHLLGKEKTDIGTSGTATASTEAKNALSMYLVLDRSGSMDEKTTTPTKRSYTYNCGTWWKPKSCTGTADDFLTKLESLKLAAADLFTTLNAADPTAVLVRTGGDSYSTNADTPINLAWGTAATMAYVNALVADGSTNSAPAFVAAYNALKASSENNAHKIKNGQVPSKFIVFMTDGENNVKNADATTKTYCDKARKDGIEVYTIPFMAPEAGQNLLKYCATSSSHYIPAENGDELSAAFKFIGSKATALSARLSK